MRRFMHWLFDQLRPGYRGEHFQRGGPIASPQQYLVGEKGPEFIRPAGCDWDDLP